MRDLPDNMPYATFASNSTPLSLKRHQSSAPSIIFPHEEHVTQKEHLLRAPREKRA
jgi:hypothetical protein